MYIPATLFHVVPKRLYTVNSYPSQVAVFIGIIFSANTTMSCTAPKEDA